VLNGASVAYLSTYFLSEQLSSRFSRPPTTRTPTVPSPFIPAVANKYLSKFDTPIGLDSGGEVTRGAKF